MQRYTVAQLSRFRDELRGIVKGDVRFDDLTLQLYSGDAGLLQCRPFCVVCPKNTDDVLTIVRFAAEYQLPVHPRGCGTGLTGEALGNGIVLDFSKYMRRLLLINSESAVVQPGLMLRRLNKILQRAQERQFPAAAGNVHSTTIGSVLSRNGAGRRFLLYGYPSDYLLGLKVVTGTGDLLNLDRNELMTVTREHDPELNSGIRLAQEIAYGKEYAFSDRVGKILNGTQLAAARVRRTQSQTSVAANVPNRLGYHLDTIIQHTPQDISEPRRAAADFNPQRVDLSRLFAGSEGTLGLIVEAKIRTVPIEPRGSAFALFFEGLDQAVATVAQLLPLKPILCELLGRRRLTLIRGSDVRYFNLIPAETEALILVEFSGDVFIDQSHSFRAYHISKPEEYGLFDELIQRNEAVLLRLPSAVRPVPMFDDIAVPVAALEQFVPKVINALQEQQITASFAGHIGQGAIRIQPLLDVSQPDMLAKLSNLAETLFPLVWQYHGTVSSEWGTGLLKSQYVVRQETDLLPLYRNIKSLFDPQNILNPGKVLPAEFDVETKNKHFIPAQSERSGLQTALHWDAARMTERIAKCTGCGECLQHNRQTRMCPVFHGGSALLSAPRTKIDLIRAALKNEIDLNTLTNESSKRIAELCIQCRLCDLDCPAGIDTAALSSQILAAHAAAHGLALDSLFLSYLDKILSAVAPLNYSINGLLKYRLARWLLEKTFRIPQGQVIPPLARIPFIRRTQLARWLRRPKIEYFGKDRVALLVGMYANFFDPQLAEYAVRILEHNGLSVEIPAYQSTSGLPAISQGHYQRAVRLAQRNTRLRADLIRQGYSVITLEPNAALCLKRDYQYLLDSEDAVLTAEHITDFSTFLWQRHRENKLQLDFQALRYRVAYHAPCRALALSASRVTESLPAEKLLRLIPELSVQRLEKGCCGMGVLFGFRQQYYRQSLQVGTPLFNALRKNEFDFGVSDCNLCCLQMSHGSRKQAVHPIRLLAEAYGM